MQRDPALSPTISLAAVRRGSTGWRSGFAARGGERSSDWARGLAALLQDREALDKAIADPARLPRVPPGMPIGMDERSL